jgi:hypothetical protein
VPDVDWWRLPAPPPIEQPAPLTPPEPAPAPYIEWPAHPDPDPDGDPWWSRLRPAYNGTAALAALGPGEWWGHVLHNGQDDGHAAGAWVVAAVVAGCAAGMVHVYRGFTVRRWLARVALFATLLGPVLALPVVHALVYLITGVAP